ncbi:hypothetical protein Ndes2526B_g09081 [Nannochloris sp. 'desiccata']|nr:hypothetical protein KSW81_001371 [Chlorella desiccata (nom. nud.)]KAH7616975.1 hypothetical protein NADE_001777 [Chlorella desiccata (nom. nud.)]
MLSRSRGLVVVRAESGGLGNFFKKDGNKQDAARKALQEAFAGKKDPFAAEEERRRKEGGGGNGGGGGGGGGFGGGFNFGDFSDGFKKWLKNTLSALAAALCFFGFIALFLLWKPVLEVLNTIVRTVLRLDGNPRVQMAAGSAATPDFNKKDGLGNVEEAVMSKWAGEDVAGSSDDEESGSEEEEDE